MVDLKTLYEIWIKGQLSTDLTNSALVRKNNYCTLMSRLILMCFSLRSNNNAYYCCPVGGVEWSVYNAASRHNIVSPRVFSPVVVSLLQDCE